MAQIITFEHNSNADGGFIQPSPVISSGVFTQNNTNTTSIEAVSVHSVTGELVCHHHPQWEEHTCTIIFPIPHQRVANAIHNFVLLQGINVMLLLAVC